MVRFQFWNVHNAEKHLLKPKTHKEQQYVCVWQYVSIVSCTLKLPSREDKRMSSPEVQFSPNKWNYGHGPWLVAFHWEESCDHASYSSLWPSLSWLLALFNADDALLRLSLMGLWWPTSMMRRWCCSRPIKSTWSSVRRSRANRVIIHTKNSTMVRKIRLIHA